ncbi:alpha/beta fold hydrolase [Micromonospora taraxaci]|uniref:alpha/beta fold hydrolase n=1 Tax=Micromonospora taraxaci TaxID=1316803 RepID=UPI00142EC711|nr:alpha/beta fold hydrolase [Micromonospora taraxaci]
MTGDTRPRRPRGPRGGILLYDGWLGIFGGSPSAEVSLPSIGQVNAFPVDVDWTWTPTEGLIVANDVLGGVFFLNGLRPAAGRPGVPGEVIYFDPRSLDWTRMRLSHREWLTWSVSGELPHFYDGLLWPRWREDVAALRSDQGIAVLPSFWNGTAPATGMTRTILPMADILTFQFDAARRRGRSLAGVFGRYSVERAADHRSEHPCCDTPHAIYCTLEPVVAGSYRTPPGVSRRGDGRGNLMSTNGRGIENVVLVHGAFADGSGWRGVYDKLTTLGYRVTIVQNPLTSMEDDVAATTRVLDRQNGPTILVGHSWGGTVITETGVHPNVAGLVYVSALAPDAGETTAQQYEGFGPTPDFVIDVAEDGYGFLNPDTFKAGFAADASDADAAFLRDSQVPVNMAAFSTPVKNAAWRDKPSWAVIATDDRAFDQAMLQHMATRIKAKITNVAASHALFATQPGVVSDVIVTAAQNAGGAR